MTRQRFLSLWHGEMLDRPPMIVMAPRAVPDAPEVEPFRDEERFWTDPDYLLPALERELSTTFYGGDGFHVAWTKLGEAAFARELRFHQSTFRIVPWVESWGRESSLTLDSSGGWWLAARQVLRAYAEAAAGRYLVGLYFLPGLDTLMTIRGTGPLCLDLLDEPDRVRAARDEVDRALKRLFREGESLIHSASAQEGLANWFGIWAPGSTLMLQCDFSCTISRSMFDDLALPSIAGWVDFLDYPMYHLDGPGAIHHLDSLLSLEKLRGIQWEPGAGNPSAIEWLPLLKRVQSAGKFVAFVAEPRDVPVALRELDPRRLCLRVHCASEKEACDFLESASVLDLR